MSAIRKKSRFLSVAAVLLGALIVPASAQVNCTANVPNQMVTRIQGNTEQVGDLILTCTGGTPTPANSPVPQVNIQVFLNTNFTSQVTQPPAAPYAANFSEALLLVDEPNRPSAGGAVKYPLLNCGNLGAPDNGVSGPGVCAITSTGNPNQTYDGTPNAAGNPLIPGAPNCAASRTDSDQPSTAVYGCGRPNVFQARNGSAPNSFVFLGVPFDPQLSPAVRTFHITNVRVDSTEFAPAGFPAAQIHATVTVQGSSAVRFGPAHTSSADEIVGYAINGLAAKTAGSTVRVIEGFAEAWRERNVAGNLANSVFSAGSYHYNMPDALYPVQAAQNVPGVLYNTEDLFQWQNNASNGPPSTNPPAGYGVGGVTTNTKSPFFSSPFYHPGFSTHIERAGVSEAGTRIALTYYTPGESITVPNLVYLHSAFSPTTITGVMVLTLTNGAGAGPFDPAPGTSTTSNNGLASPPTAGMFTYEVLYSNMYQVEFADIPLSVSGGGEALLYATYAPFYTDPNASLAQPASAFPLPRFAWDGQMMFVRPQRRLGRD